MILMIFGVKTAFKYHFSKILGFELEEIWTFDKFGDCFVDILDTSGFSGKYQETFFVDNSIF